MIGGALGQATQGMGSMLQTTETQQREDCLRLLRIYEQAMKPESAQNRFRGCLFNKIAVENKKDRDFLLEHVPTKVGSAPVDLEKWMRAVQDNPERGQFLPT